MAFQSLRNSRVDDACGGARSTWPCAEGCLPWSRRPCNMDATGGVRIGVPGRGAASGEIERGRGRSFFLNVPLPTQAGGGSSSVPSVQQTPTQLTAHGSELRELVAGGVTTFV